MFTREKQREWENNSGEENLEGLCQVQRHLYVHKAHTHTHAAIVSGVLN